MTENDAVAVAEAFDRLRDPLGKHESTFADIDVDPLEIFVEQVLAERDLADSTVSTYEIALRHWREYMNDAGRHPACPNTDHVTGFINHLRETRENHPSTVKQKVQRVHEAYQYWQSTAEFPHSQDYDPIEQGLSETSFEDPGVKSPPPLTVGELRSVLSSIMHLRNCLIVLLQSKLGLRASELCNIKLGDIDVSDSVVCEHYDTLGTQSILDGRPNAIYIPHDRDRNKSGNPRVLPIDSETRELLVQYLRRRPDADVPWLFLSRDGHGQLNHIDVKNIWIDAFRPMYTETKHHRSVTSHFGRHFFTTYWRVEQDLSRPLLQYLRGDVPGTNSIEDRDGIDWYIHTYYEDVEERYRDKIYQLQI